VGRDSSVGIATAYGLDGPGIESRWGARFFAPVQTGPGAHPASCTIGYRVFHGGKERPERDADPSSPSSAAGHKRLELYLYSPCGPYGVYSASLPVQGCTLPLPKTNLKRLYHARKSIHAIKYIKNVCCKIQFRSHLLTCTKRSDSVSREKAKSIQ
jgi:hypothetical protein